MERRAASHTEEEEMNQRRRLLNLARKGDLKAINRLFELYQVRVYSGENLKKVGRGPFVPPSLRLAGKGDSKPSHAARKAAVARRRLATMKAASKAGSRKASRKTAPRSSGKAGRKAAHG